MPRYFNPIRQTVDDDSFIDVRILIDDLTIGTYHYPRKLATWVSKLQIPGNWLACHNIANMLNETNNNFHRSPINIFFQKMSLAHQNNSI
jgi:hypothetical protein